MGSNKIANFGFSGLKTTLSNKSGEFSTFNTSKLNTFFTPVRVVNIVLNEKNYFFSQAGEWNGLGAIQYELVDNPTSFDPNSIAYPFDSNVKNYPLINEIVYLINLPNSLIGENNSNSYSYYFRPVNIWNHPHHNAYPSIANEPNPPAQKDYVQTQEGSTRIQTNNAKQIYLGNTFIEKSDIHPLQPFEGDVIHEGRWGNSIRLGSTVKNTGNNWSSAGDNGDPITIIRNGQGEQTQEGWVPIIEDINNNVSSIYLTSTQKIPSDVISTDYTSYTNSGFESPKKPNEFSEFPQIILDSGRLLFNAYNDHILLSAAKSVNLNTKQTVNIDTKKLIVQADNIYLGREDLATQHLMLGDNTVDFLNILIESLLSIANTLQNLESDPVVNGKPATFYGVNPKTSLKIQSVSLISKLETLQNQLKNGILTSKLNYTL